MSAESISGEESSIEGVPKTLSIVLTVVEGGTYVRDFLCDVAAFEDPPSLEVIVPYDDSIAEIAKFQDAFPDVRFLPLGPMHPKQRIASGSGEHELHDRRRSAGLAAATGDIVGILDDRGRPQKDWARVLVRLHTEGQQAVIGGAIECKEPASLLTWSLYVTDFGRYGRPFESGPADWVSDVNISYTRKALEETRHLWADRYHGPIVHWHLIDRGEQLWLSNELVVHYQRPPASFRLLLRERFGWGRLFGEIRVRDISESKRWGLIFASPLIAPLLWVRHFRTQLSKGRGGRYLRALPCVIILSTAWTLGEVWGYITRRN